MAECINALAALSDAVLPGLAEGRQLAGRHTAEDIAAFYLERGAKQVVVKLGPEGAESGEQSSAKRFWLGAASQAVRVVRQDAATTPEELC